MKKSPKLYLLVGLALLVAGLLAVYLMVAGAWNVNSVQDHLSSGTILQTDCSAAACHQSVLGRTGYDAHYLKRVRGRGLAFFDKPGPGGEYDGCGKCHQSTSVRSAYGEIEGVSDPALRKQVDPKFCLTCHGTFAKGSAGPPSTKHGGVEYPTGSCGLGLGNCHAPLSVKDPAPRHQSRTYINQIIAGASAFCLDCHGGRPKYAVEETNPVP